MRELRIRDSELMSARVGMHHDVPSNVVVNLFYNRRLREAGFELAKVSPLGLDPPELAPPWEMFRDDDKMELVVRQGGL